MIQLFNVHVIMFSIGSSISWSSPMIPKFANITTSPFERVLTSDEEMWITSLLPLGSAFGSLLFPYLSDKFGRKRILLYSSIPIAGSFLSMAFGKIVEIFYIARFVNGLAAGAIFTVMVPYVVELLHKSKKDIGLYIGTTVCSGILLSYSLGPFVSVMIFNLVLTIFPIVFLVLFSLFGQEAPHYYIIKKDEEQARKILKKSRTSSVDIEEELKEIKLKYLEEKNGKLLDLFKTRGLRKALVLAICLIIFQHFSGINMILFYGQNIFEETGSNLKPEYCPIITGSIQLVSSLIAPILSDRFGRKCLLTFSAFGMMISEAALGAYVYVKDLKIYNMDYLKILPILLMVLFLFFYNSGYGILLWPIIGELFPLRVKVVVISILSYFFWMTAFFLTKYFAVMVKLFGLAKYYWFFAICCAFAAIFSKFGMIETGGQSLKDIQDVLNR